MGIVEKLSQLITSKSNLRNKINEKISDTSKQIPEDAKLDDFTSYVDNIEGGGGEDFIIEDASYLNYKGNRDSCIKTLAKKIKACNFYLFSYQSNGNVDEIEVSTSSNMKQGTNEWDINNNQPYNAIYMEQAFNGSNILNVKINNKSDNGLPNIYFARSIAAYGYVNKIEFPEEYPHIMHGGDMFSSSYNIGGTLKFNIDRCVSMDSMFRGAWEIDELYFIGRPFAPNGKTIYYNNGKEDISIVMDNYYASLNGTFTSCSDLKKIIGLDITYVQKISTGSFGTFSCSRLEVLDFTGTENVLCDIDLSNCISMTEQSYLDMLDTLPYLNIGRTIKKNGNLTLSDSTIAAFSVKGYTIA